MWCLIYLNPLILAHTVESVCHWVMRTVKSSVYSAYKGIRVVWELFTVSNRPLHCPPIPLLWKEQTKGHCLPHIRMLRLKQCSVSCPAGVFLWAVGPSGHTRCRSLRDEMIRLDYRVIISDTSQAWKVFVLKKLWFFSGVRFLRSKTERGMEEKEDMGYLLKGRRAVAGHFHFLTVFHFLAYLNVLC